MAAERTPPPTFWVNLRGANRGENANFYYRLRLETRQIPMLDIHMMH